MTIAEKVGLQLPLLRRYARALTGSQATGDAFVRETLEAALADRDLLDRIGEGRVPLYAAFHRLWAACSPLNGEHEQQAGLHELAAQERLAHMTPTHRAALLLTTLEDFTSEDAAEVLGLDSARVDDLVAHSLREIEDESATDVLIIEDQPLIAMQLEGLVSELGHRVVGTASTRSQAREMFARDGAGLVLADIQLADGSSGIDAVEDILSTADVPVIFITAYPELLLTGERPEPTYLITKPFQESSVRAAISQAMFFNSSLPLD